MSEFKQILRRHDERASRAYPEGCPDNVVQEFRDVAYLITQVHTLRKALNGIRKVATKNDVPGQPKTKVKALRWIAESAGRFV